MTDEELEAVRAAERTWAGDSMEHDVLCIHCNRWGPWAWTSGVCAERPANVFGDCHQYISKDEARRALLDALDEARSAAVLDLNVRTVLANERDEARAEVERLREALGRMGEVDELASDIMERAKNEALGRAEKAEAERDAIQASWDTISADVRRLAAENAAAIEWLRGYEIADAVPEPHTRLALAAVEHCEARHAQEITTATHFDEVQPLNIAEHRTWKAYRRIREEVNEA